VVKKAIQKADILIEALPYIKRFQHKVMVIKCGGRQLLNQNTIKNILQDIVFMNCVGLNPVLVHGGGPSITEEMRKAGKKVKFHHGHRVTDKHTLEIVSAELNRLNAQMVKRITQFGAKAKGLSGKKGEVIKAKKFSAELGLVGKVGSIDTQPVRALLKKNFVPVIAPLGVGKDKQVYNINADMVAAEIAAKLGAWKLVLLTDVKGILRNKFDEDSLISTLKVAEVPGLLKRKVIYSGMIPKVNACIAALEKDVKKTHIIDGSIPRSLLIEIFTDKGIGTQILK